MVAVSLKKVFFKQKTAYAMVRCDWSSDVCSSDLQVVKELRCHFSEKKAMALLYKLESYTRELVSLTREIIELTRKFEERWSQR